jgi:hypothetical protein
MKTLETYFYTAFRDISSRRTEMRGTKNNRKKSRVKNTSIALMPSMPIKLSLFVNSRARTFFLDCIPAPIFASSAHPFSIDVFILSLVLVGFSLRAGIHECPDRTSCGCNDIDARLIIRSRIRDEWHEFEKVPAKILILICERNAIIVRSSRDRNGSTLTIYRIYVRNDSGFFQWNFPSQSSWTKTINALII